MTGFLLGGILIVGLVAVGEGYAIFGRMQLFLTAAEQILAALHVPLRQVPSKSAPRTIAAADARPRAWLQTLRRLAGLREQQVDDVDLARWEDDGGTSDDTPTEPDPADVDPWRAQFTFADGGRRATALPPTGTGGDT